ncbi:MAG: tyrosine-type recombinase/integrase [Desulfuromonadaceae bacterium]|nr:tyrosine-type recombinase/integrase [Desulfuromonadaceae bacterium]
MKANMALVNLDEQKQQFGSIKTFRHSKKLYVDFHYFSRRITKSTGLNDTVENRERVIKFLNRIGGGIEKQTFKFVEVFPNATEEEKVFFSRLEGREFRPEAHQVTIGDYVKKWREKMMPTFDSATKRRDFEQAIDQRLLPYFQQMTFYQLTSTELQQFVAKLVWKDGKNKGKRLSRSRISNILIPLRAIWNDACDQFRWNIRSPFETIGKKLPKSQKKQPVVLRFDEWMKILSHVPDFYRPVMELMIMTGMIASELRGLRKCDIEKKYITIQNSIVLDVEKEKLKTWYRKRKIPITQAIWIRLEKAMQLSKTDYVFVMEDGSEFDYASFKKTVWTKAFEKAGIPYQKPYVTRHTFAAWGLTIQTDHNKMVSMMGHGSKQMIYEVYGNYVEGLEDDAEQILKYFGADFIRTFKVKVLDFSKFETNADETEVVELAA